MRYLFFFAVILAWGTVSSQGSGFSFSYTGPTQILVGPDCEAELEWGHPNTPTASSNIPGGFIVSFNIYSISGGYDIGDMVPGGSTVTVFYQALDNFGNTSLFGFTIDFIDLLPPIFDAFSLPPANVTVSCITNVPPPADVEASDNCDNENANLTITFTENNNAVICTGGTITRTWVADDDLGNQATFIQTITVLPDVTPPVITNNLQNGMAPCSTAMAQYTAWLNTQRANFMATDNGCGILSLTDNAPSPAIITSFCGVIEVTFTATDQCNNSSSVIKTFTIFNSVAPVINSPASDASGNCSQGNIAQIFNNWINTHGGATATDDCSSIFWSTFPPSPSVEDTCDASIVVLFIAGDGCNNFDTTSASFFLTDDTGPTITMDPSTMILSCTAANIDSILMDWLMTGGNSEAQDLCTADEDLALGFQIGDSVLTFEEVLEAWQDSLASGCKDNVFIGGLGIDNVKAYLPVRFTYTDNCNNSNGETGYFGITDNGRPQFTTMPVDTSFACSGASNWEDFFMEWYNTAGFSSYTDLCSEVTVHQSISADSAIQYLTAALDTACLQGVAITIEFGLTDECGNNSLTNPPATFGLQDTIVPVLVSPALDLSVPCSENVEMQLQSWLDTLGGAIANDGCGALNWEFSWTDTSGMVQTGIPGSGPFPEIGELGCTAAIEIIFTAFDICDNSVSDTAEFSTLDTLPPSIEIVEDSLHLTCQDSIPMTPPMVTDGCDSNPLISFTDSVSLDTCLGFPDLIIRTWMASDACGNTSSAQQWFFRKDTIPPTFDLPADTVAYCSVDTLSLINVTDNCDPAPVTSWEDQFTGPACGQTLMRTWIVTDACGNSATAVQQFDLSDESSPEIIYSPGHFVFGCDSTSGGLQTSYEQWSDSVDIQDDCSEAFYFIALRNSYTLEDTSTWPGTPVPDSIMIMCGMDMLIEADLVAYDECGNVVVDSISFLVQDTVGPSFIDCPDVMMVQADTTCTAAVSLTSPQFEEICFPENIRVVLLINGGDTITLDSTLTVDTIFPVGIHTIEWIAEDCNGNAGTCFIMIEIIDENALNISCPPDTLLYTPAGSCEVELQILAPGTMTGSCGTGANAWSGYIEGIAEPSSFEFDSAADKVLVTFSAGLHRVFLIAQDSTGDSDTCSYMVEVRDTILPLIFCQTDTLILPPSGLENIDVSTTSLLVSASDECGIDSVSYDPSIINCSSNGQDVSITITVMDQNGNSSTCQSILVVQTQPLMPLWESQLCDDTLRLYANLPDGPDSIYTFSWSGPNSFSSTDQNPVIPDADTTYSGTYQLTVESDNGCVSTGSTQILVQELTAPLMNVSTDTLCDGTSIIFSTQGFSGPVVYEWFHVLPAGDTLLGSTTEPQFTFIPVQPGSYSVYAIVSQDTCISEPGIPVVFEVVPQPVADIQEVEMFLCVDDTLFLLPVMSFDSLSYVWSGPAGYESNVPSPPGIPAGEIDSTAIYSLVVSNDYCSSTPDSVQATVQLPPSPPVITGDTIACEGGMLEMTSSSTGLAHVWIDPIGDTLSTPGEVLILSPAMMSQSGVWQTIAFEHGCPSDTSDFFSIQIDSAIQIVIEAPSQVCQGDSITLSVVPFILGEYTWTGPGGFLSSEDSPTTIAENGTYYASLLTATGCEADDSMEVTVDALPLITMLVTDADSCVDGNEAVTIWAETQPQFSDAFEYHWEGPSAFTMQDSSITIDSATAAANGIYTLVIVNGTCTSEQTTIELTLLDSPDQPVITGDNVYCYADSVILTIDSPLPGGVYTWSSADTNAIIDSPGTLIIPGATPEWSGDYMVEVFYNGCISPSSMITVQVKEALFPPAILSPPLVCEGDSLTLVSDAPPGATVLWIGSNGFESFETQPVIYPVTPADEATYQTIYTLDGCPSPVSNPYEIFVQPAVTAPSAMADLEAVCIDYPGSIHICIEPGTSTTGAMYTWLLNDVIIGTPGTDSCIVVESEMLQGGVNTIAAIASLQGCPSETGNAAIVTGDEVPSQQANAGLDIEVCPGETVILDAADPAPGSGLWTSNDNLVVFSDGNDPHADIIGLPSGEYSLTWTLSYATCTDYSSDSVLVSVLFSPVTHPDTVQVPFGQTQEFTVVLNDNISMGPFTVEITMQPQKGNALHVDNGIFRYTPNIGFVGTDMMIYRICSVDCPEECSESVVILQVGNEDDCFVPTLFTPNEDGINDILILPCLETDQFPENKLLIFNEWGDVNLVAKPYLNDWDGTASGDPLPVGTYYYIMDFGDGNIPKRSFLVLER